MSTPVVASAPPPKRWRRRLPLGLVVLAGVVIAVIYAFPNPDFGRGPRFWSAVFSILATLGLLALWVLFLSGLRWWARLGILALGMGVVVLLRQLVRVDFDGDMVPVALHFSWEATPGSDLSGQPARTLEASDLSDGPTDYPEYRNRQRDGVVTGPALVRSLASDRAPVWRKEIGGGYAGFVVAGHALATIEQRGAEEAVVCYDARTGDQVWEHRYPASFQESLGGDGPRATPTIHGEFIYSLGATGKLLCLEARSGKSIWEADILAGNKNIMWGMSGSPLLTDGLVIVNPGKQQDSAADRAVIAYDEHTGQEVWHAGNHPAGYCSPMRVQLAGQDQVLIFDADGLAGYDLHGQGERWRYDWPGFNGINVAQPLLFADDRLFISSGYDKGCALVHIKRQGEHWSVDEVWKNQSMHCKFTSPVAYQQHIYGLDDGIVACVDVNTGKRLWKGQRYGHGQMVRQDDLLVVLGEHGQLALVKADPTAFQELGRLRALERDKTWNCPALADGRVYVRNHQQMACFDLRAER